MPKPRRDDVAVIMVLVAASASATHRWSEAARIAWEKPASKKARRIAFHVVRGAKKFVFGTGNAAWVVGTTMLVLVMPLVFEIDREQQAIEWEAQAGGVAPKP